ncbi:BTB/POZ protein [Tribonema minus]|uniref:BTB/POZ protein n=1 Tax=Tribonema minus TaxID=303371 RepID=A0A836CHY6_9STRA|nr:BTB/POZ protein [Tribonema minus]
MAANQQGANGSRASVNEHVEFVVKAAEDLILEGKERSLVRVRAGTPYSCLMLKNQRFSSLFRHYAKHHGLRKEDLAYYFTEALQNEDTPESIFLQPRDEVIVRKRRLNQSDEDSEDDDIEDLKASGERFISQFGALLADDEHCDVTFFVGDAKAPVKAHKVVLVARSEYFRNMFRRGAMREGATCEVSIESHEEQTVRWMLEYFYTNEVVDLHRCTADQVAAVLSIAEEYQLLDLKKLCEVTARGIVTTANVARLLAAAEQFHAATLRSACMAFVQKNMSDCAYNTSFTSDLMVTPKLCVSILKHISGDTKPDAAGSASNRGTKRRRVDIEVEADVAQQGGNARANP